MRKIILLFAATLFGASAAMAQMPVEVIRVNESSLKKEMSKSDADVADPKKNTKFRPWMDRGDLYYEVGMAGSKGLYRGISRETLEQKYDLKDKYKPSSKTVSGVDYIYYEYPYFNAYYNQEEQLVLWEPTLNIDAKAFNKAYEAYDRAAKLNDKQHELLLNKMKLVSNAVKQQAVNNQYLNNNTAAADNYLLGGIILGNPLIDSLDNASVYNAARLYMMSDEYDKAIDAFKINLENGYEDDGNIYYYLYHSYQSKKDLNSAKDILLVGVDKFPSNERLTSSLAALFASGDVDGNLDEIIAKVEQAAANDPTNAFLLAGLGDMYNRVDAPEKSYEVYKKLVVLQPDNFAAWANLGNTEFNNAYQKYEEFRKEKFTSQTELDNAKNVVLQEFVKSVNSLEKAHEIEPTNRDVVGLLKDATFILRDNFPEMATKNAKYLELYNSMK